MCASLLPVAHQDDSGARFIPGQPRKKEGKQFFFEKKNQKTFICKGQHQFGPFERHAGSN
jgi:hypothetical protein